MVHGSVTYWRILRGYVITYYCIFNFFFKFFLNLPGGSSRPNCVHSQKCASTDRITIYDYPNFAQNKMRCELSPLSVLSSPMNFCATTQFCHSVSHGCVNLNEEFASFTISIPQPFQKNFISETVYFLQVI